jgi:hypothetical protein
MKCRVSDKHRFSEPANLGFGPCIPVRSGLVPRPVWGVGQVPFARPLAGVRERHAGTTLLLFCP